MDNWPDTREEWRAAWPDRQENYLAWCNAVRRSPLDFNGAEYIAWINKKSAEFRAERGIKRDMVPEFMGVEFTTFLWGELPL